VVKEIRWGKGRVEVFDESHHSYNAHKVIVTVPLGVWMAEENSKGPITYSPALTHKQEAAKQMGFGSAIKILLFFKEAFWEELSLPQQPEVDLKRTGFIISEEEIPTWWTQLPDKSSMLTGWVAGPKAFALKDAPNETVLSKSIVSLSKIFNIRAEVLQEQLLSWQVFNWSADPFTRGAYAFSTTGTEEARKELMQPVEGTLFFAGDAFYDGLEMGTVEAALTSGLRACEEVLTALP
jgi:monoamine oxidase